MKRLVPTGRGARGAAQAAPQHRERDEHGLTDDDKWRGRQMLCHVCHGRPCADSCPEQWLPDRLEWKAARAGLPILEWARLHGDWTRAHAQRPDVAAWLEGQQPGERGQATGERGAGATGAEGEGETERRIPARAAMAQAMAVVAGEVRAEELRPLGGDARAQAAERGAGAAAAEAGTLT